MHTLFLLNQIQVMLKLTKLKRDENLIILKKNNYFYKYLYKYNFTKSNNYIYISKILMHVRIQ
jgi:hypothetical protein